MVVKCWRLLAETGVCRIAAPGATKPHPRLEMIRHERARMLPAGMEAVW